MQIPTNPNSEPPFASKKRSMREPPRTFARESQSADRAADPSAEGFRDAIDALRQETEASLSYADYAHWNKMRRWGIAATAAGYSTAWLGPNLFSAAAIALGNTTKWAVVAHHASHKGLDAIEGVPARHHSKRFAKGARRFIDWLDWMVPEAWHLEHNVLHHFYTGEATDPDLVEENAQLIRDAKLPRALKYAAVGFYAATWKYTYYAPNTFRILYRTRLQRLQREADVARSEDLRSEARDASSRPSADAFTYLSLFDVRKPEGRAFWSECILPYGLARFVALPLAYAPLGPWAVFSVWSNSILAECMANIHSFVIIGPNHAGSDVYRFDPPKQRQAGFYARQVMGSVNYTTGGDVRDFLHGFLNYQIEHHLFPNLPPRAYQRIAPKVKAICKAHGIPYLQEPVLRRFRKMVEIMVGATSMRRA
jgi:fatty acid desaturase